MFTKVTNDLLRGVVSILQTPVVVVLLILIVVAVAMAGSFTMEYFTEHKKLKEKIPDLLNKLTEADLSDIADIVMDSEILRRQKAAVIRILEAEDMDPDSRDAFASQLLYDEGVHYRKNLRVPELVLRLGPMFGLLGTLIPLGPGLIALGQGNTEVLSQSLLIAFDTTAAGVIVSAFAFVVQYFRKSWYQTYAKDLESITDVVLDKMDERAEMMDEDAGRIEEKAGRIEEAE